MSLVQIQNKDEEKQSFRIRSMGTYMLVRQQLYSTGAQLILYLLLTPNMLNLFEETFLNSEMWNRVEILPHGDKDPFVSYTRVYKTSAGCLRSIYPSLGMRQLFGDVTMGQ